MLGLARAGPKRGIAVVGTRPSVVGDADVLVGYVFLALDVVAVVREAIDILLGQQAEDTSTAGGAGCEGMRGVEVCRGSGVAGGEVLAQE